MKTSSLGDVIHTLPALGDALSAIPSLRFDWVVEEAFTEIPGMHAAVSRVIPLAIRRWRHAPLAAWRSGEWQSFRGALGLQRYDSVIDAQGLLKSAVVTRMVAAQRCGLDKHSAREPLAALAYDRVFRLPREMHAIERTRMLFAGALNYAVPVSPISYGIDANALPANAIADAENALLFLHGTARGDKCWPESHWQQLCSIAGAAGMPVLLPWGNRDELDRARRLAQVAHNATVLPQLQLREIAALMLRARAMIAVDSGLGHLAAALGRPCVSLYGPTRVALVGTRGNNQRHIKAAGDGGTMASITPAQVWTAVGELVQPS